MSNLSIALLALALVGSVGTGVALQTANTSDGMTTIEGKVVHVAWNPHWEIAVEFEVQNSTTYHVELGPPWWWASQHLPEIKVNDTLKVEGVLHEGNEIDAYTIWINGGSAITIRSAGMPEWAESRSGQTAQGDETDED